MTRTMTTTRRLRRIQRGLTVPTDVVLSVTYAGEPEVVYEYPVDGLSRLFGRDEGACDIIVWSAINGVELSRVAGRIWRMEGELWLRNLSTTHELYLVVEDMPRQEPLPPRRDDGIDTGPARAIPAGIATVRAPGGCELVVHQYRAPAPAAVGTSGSRLTRRLSVPSQLTHLAALLCAPLLRGGQLPATYAQIAEQLASTPKKVRTDVGRLCAIFATDVPDLQSRITERREREARQLGLPSDPRLVGGVWRWDAYDEQLDEPADIEQRRALALPDYYEVAQLLVRRGLISLADLPRANPPATAP